jgi:hypothetical protein
MESPETAGIAVNYPAVKSKEIEFTVAEASFHTESFVEKRIGKWLIRRYAWKEGSLALKPWSRFMIPTAITTKCFFPRGETEGKNKFWSDD